MRTIGHKIIRLGSISSTNDYLKQLAGQNIVEWDGTDDHGLEVATGIYFYRLTVNKQSSAKKMMLLR